jgi:hypothetical protein
MIEILPLHIYYRIREFCSFHDYIRLMNLNKKAFRFIKTETVYYPLTREFTILFTGTNFYRKLLSLVKFPAQQIGIILDADDDLEVLNEISFRKLYLAKRIKIPTKKPLSLSLFSGTSFLKFFGTNVDLHATVPLESVLKLSLCDLKPEYFRSDFHNFLPNSLKVLEIRNCTLPHMFLSDITKYAPNLWKLHLSQLSGQIEFSANFLSALPFLQFIELKNCANLFDIAPLSKLYNLKLSQCSNVNYHLYNPMNHSLSIDSLLELPAMDISNIKHFSLRACIIPENFFTLYQYQLDTIQLKSLSLHDVRIQTTTVPNNNNNPSSPSITNKIYLPSFLLAKLSSLLLVSHSFFSEQQSLKSLYYCELVSCVGLDSTEYLGDIVILKLISCFQLKNLDHLGGPRQRSIMISNLINCIACFKSLKAVPQVYLQKLASSINLEELGSVRDLTLHDISGAIRILSPPVSSTLGFHQVTFIRCLNLKDITGLEHIPLLTINSCPALKVLPDFKMDSNEKVTLSMNDYHSILNNLDRNEEYLKETRSNSVIYLRKKKQK